VSDFPLNLPAEQIASLTEEIIENATVNQVAELQANIRADDSASGQLNSMAEFIRRYFNTDAMRHTAQPPRLNIERPRSDHFRDDSRYYAQQIRNDFYIRSPHSLYAGMDTGYKGIPIKQDTGPTVEQMESDYRV
jgi:hypothetical protein